MNIKSLLIATTVCLFSTVALAQSAFFSTQNKGWEVVGYPQRNELHPVCRGERNYNDGSQFALIKDLADEELYIVLMNATWNISDAPGNYTARINFYSGNRVTGSHIQYELLNKNTIRIRNITAEKFLPDFMGFSRMVILMPGTIQNAEINLNGSTDLIAIMSDCIRVFKLGKGKPGTNL